MSWKGIKVRHEDGRTGQIRQDAMGYRHRTLFIQIDGGGEASVQLNSDGPDSGDTGWSWFSDLLGASAQQWLPLGNHNEQQVA